MDDRNRNGIKRDTADRVEAWLDAARSGKPVPLMSIEDVSSYIEGLVSEIDIVAEKWLHASKRCNTLFESLASSQAGCVKLNGTIDSLREELERSQKERKANLEAYFEAKGRAERAEAALAEAQSQGQYDAVSAPTCDIVDIVLLTDRAQRAEADLAEAQDRALRFEKLLKAEEARKVDEPVLDKRRVLETVFEMARLHSTPIANTFYWVLRLFSEMDGTLIGGSTASRNPYKWK